MGPTFYDSVEHFVTNFPLFSHTKLLCLLLFRIIILRLIPNTRKLIKGNWTLKSS